MASAKTISPAEAEAIAEQFMQRGSIATPRLAKAPTRHAETAEQPYYIYNSQEVQGGYVIISGDDRFGDILAYSTTGSINPADAPEGLRGLLELYTAAYNALDKAELPSGGSVTPTGDVVVAPLLGNIAWGQGDPFNTLTPISEGTTHFYTGCVATAATQIMRFYNYPDRGTGTKTYTDPLSGNTLTANFGATTYSWADMPAVAPDAPTAQQIEAYSTLAAHFGIAVEMQYEASGSGTYDVMVPNALRNYFGYDAAVRSHQRDYYTTSEWMGMIKTELDEGRPVFYGGSSDTGTGGHAFVIDGYDSNDYVHVNWGWYGSSNGYFKINHLDPETLGAGGGYGGYNLNQDMVTGIRPAQAGSKRDYAVYGETRLSIDGPFNGEFLMMSFIGNNDVEPVKGRIEGALVKDGKVVATLGGEDLSLAGYAAGKPGYDTVILREVKSEAPGVADGNYRLQMAFLPEGETEWIPIRHPKNLPGYADVLVSRGFVSLTATHVPAPDVVLQTAIEPDGDLYAGGSALATFTLENRSSDFEITQVTMRLTGVDNPDAVFDATVTSPHVYDQSVETISLNFDVAAEATPGKYYLTALVKNDNGEYLFDDSAVGRAEVMVLEPATTPVVRATASPTWQVNDATASVPGRITQGETLYISGTFRNAGANGTANILARLTDTSTGKVYTFVMAEAEFTDTRAKNVIFGRPLPHDPGTYTVDFVQVADDNTQMAINTVGEPLVITVHESSALEAEAVAFEFPDAIDRGERVPYSLTVKGLKAVTKTLYIRVRQLTNKNGEIVNMRSTSFKPDVEATVSGNYTPGKELEDGIYMIIAETGNTQAQIPLGNHAVYAKTVAIGDVPSGIESIQAEGTAVAIWVEGTTLRVVAADGVEIASTDVYTASGVHAAHNGYDLAGLAPGIYIVNVVLADGTRTTAKIVLR